MANVEYLFKELRKKTEAIKNNPNATTKEIKELFGLIEKMAMSTFKNYAKDYLCYRDGIDQITPRAKFILDKIRLLWRKTLNEILPANDGYKVIIDEFGYDKVFNVVFYLELGVEDTLSFLYEELKNEEKRRKEEEQRKAEEAIEKKKEEIDETIQKYNNKLVEMALSGEYDIPVLDISISYLPLRRKEELLQKYPFVIIINVGSMPEPAFRDDYGEPFFPVGSSGYIRVEYDKKYPEFQKEIEKTIDEYRKKLDLDSIIKTYEEIITFVKNNYKKK